MVRRTKEQLNQASRLIKLYLSDTQNDPHNAWDEYIKFYLVSGQSLPTFINGIKDFIKVSKEYQKEFEYNLLLEQRKLDNKALEVDYAERIKLLTKEGDYEKVKKCYKEAESQKSNNKYPLCNLMVYLHSKFTKGIEEYNNWKFNAGDIRVFIEYGII